MSIRAADPAIFLWQLRETNRLRDPHLLFGGEFTEMSVRSLQFARGLVRRRILQKTFLGYRNPQSLGSSEITPNSLRRSNSDDFRICATESQVAR